MGVNTESKVKNEIRKNKDPKAITNHIEVSFMNKVSGLAR